ncbi:MAG: YmfQ family protein, partial [Lachnospiraceae bacterium]|nr:YmfQ family protein [Lachnospiraceae bacterium]
MEKIDLENFPVSESARKMLSYVSDGFYDKSYVGKWIFQVMGMEYDDARRIVEELPGQMFPETATWGLMYHEIKWGLPVRANLPDEERRRQICQKRDYRAPMTPHCMEKYLCNVTGFEVHISDIHDPWRGYLPAHPNVFQVFFIGEGTLDAGAAIHAIRRIKQSHTVFEACEYINNQFLLRVICAARMRITGAFWPRRNVPRHYLNGATRLDGRYPLSGYLSGQSLEFYPLALRLSCEAGERAGTAAGGRTAFCCGAAETAESKAALCIRGEGKAGTETAGAMQVSAGAGEAGRTAAAGQAVIRGSAAEAAAGVAHL